MMKIGSEPTLHNDPLSSVVLAIASYQGAPEVLRILRAVDAAGAFARFARVIVVDSCGTCTIPDQATERGWPVEYMGFETNLGSAGNLNARLSRAASIPEAKWVFAINHDGILDVPAVEALVRFGEESTMPRVGAVFPVRRFTNRGNAIHHTAPKKGVALRWLNKKPDPENQTGWSSSNAALYSLAPVRTGVLPMAELWMGWEDLAYGWQLTNADYVQLVAPEVVLDDHYEYRQVGPALARLYIANKPAWYEYYFARNLLLVARKLRRSPVEIVPRLAMEAALITALRPRKIDRWVNFSRGLFDGLRGREGQADGLR